MHLNYLRLYCSDTFFLPCWYHLYNWLIFICWNISVSSEQAMIDYDVFGIQRPYWGIRYVDILLKTILSVLICDINLVLSLSDLLSAQRLSHKVSWEYFSLFTYSGRLLWNWIVSNSMPKQLIPEPFLVGKLSTHLIIITHIAMTKYYSFSSTMLVFFKFL